MGTRNASKSTEFQGEMPVFTVDPDRLDANAIISQKGFGRESSLTAGGAVFARGRIQSPFGFTLVRDFEPIGVTAPAGEGKHPGPRDMAALLKARDGELEVWVPYQQSEDAFQEQMGSKNNLSNTARSGVTNVMNADWGYAVVEQPGKNDASIAIYRLASTLTRAQAQQAFDIGLVQREVAAKVGLNVVGEQERDLTKEQAAADAKRRLEDQAAAIQNEIIELEGNAKLNELKAKRDALKAGMGTTTTSTNPGTLRTYEIWGTLTGGTVKVPLSQVLINQGGRFSLVSGGGIVVGNEATDGFGLAGIPGRWPTVYPGQSPANSGLDPDKGVLGWDGSRAWVIPGNTLTQLFGANWRTAVYF